VPSHLEKWGARAPRARWFRRHCPSVRTLTVVFFDRFYVILFPSRMA